MVVGWIPTIFRQTKYFGRPSAVYVAKDRVSRTFYSGVKTKKCPAQYLRLSLRVHSCFSSWNEILLTLSGAQAVFWRGTGPEMHSSGTGPVTFFRGTSLAWGAQAVIWGGARPRNAPRGAGPASTRF